jgi:uncharacterized protein (TIGR00369 family)
MANGGPLPIGCPLLDALPHHQWTEGDDVIVDLDVTPAMRGPGGGVHGGLVASLVDCAGASAVALASRRPVATSAASISYLAPARVGPLRARATPLRVGTTTGVAAVTVKDAGKADRLVASALVTLALLPGDALVPTPS